MGDPTGFKDWPRQMPARRERHERLGDWGEFYLPQEPDETRRQAGRCMDCGVPFCQQGCPLGNHIPDWNDLIYRDRWLAAYRRLDATNNFPELTGRLCPAPCEAACVLAINTPAVTIEQVEKEIIERAFAEGWVEPRPAAPPTGKRVAIVGSGPAGLAAAQQLARAGHAVTVFERDEAPGGLCRFGIPDFKIEKWVIDRRLEQMGAEGVQFRCGVSVGATPTWDELRRGHDAVVVAIGAQKPRRLAIPGGDMAGVVYALDYLGRQNRAVARGDTSPIDARGKHVIVLGGGDTGSDCVGTALRQGAASLTALQLWPAPPAERAPDNPWPQWPMIFRTSSSYEEGGEREYAVEATRLTGDGQRIDTLHSVAIEIEPGPDGRPHAIRVGPEQARRCDLLVIAIGFDGAESDSIVAQLGAEVDARGNLRVDGHHATSVPGVYAAGDAMRGASLIVWAIMDGREAARAIDRALRDGATETLPTRGADSDFGGPTHRVQLRNQGSVVSDNKPAGSEVR